MSSFLRHLLRKMEKRVAQGQIKAFLEQCSFFLVTWASCSYNREARHFNSVEAGCRLGSAGALGGGWWGLPRVLLPLIFISPAHGAGSPPKLQHQEGCDGGFCRADQARHSLSVVPGRRRAGCHGSLRGLWSSWYASLSAPLSATWLGAALSAYSRRNAYRRRLA